MKSLLLTGVIAFSALISVAQPPVPSNTDTIMNNSSVQNDTTGGLKQVPGNTSVRKENKSSTDSTKTRYEKGGKSTHDASHTKKTPAKKDTPYAGSSARKAEKK